MKHLNMIGTAVLAGILVAGCGQENENKDEVAAEQPAAEAAEPAKDPNEVVLAANGKELKRAALDAEVAKTVAAMKDKIPAERLSEAKKQIAQQVAQQFIVENILVTRAKELGYAVTEADRKAREAEFLKAVAGRPDAPKSFEEAAAKHPLGKDRAMKEISDGLLIDKMIKGESAKAGKKDFDAEAQKIIDNVASNNASQAGADAKALAEIKKIQAQLADKAVTNVPAKFAELAKAKSACPSSAKGGDLGAFGHGQMVKEFDEVAFKLPVGKVSEPVKTQFGYHLILTTEKIPAVKGKDGKETEGEKVRASHILIKGGQTRPVPKKDEVVSHLKQMEERKFAQKFFMDMIRQSGLKACDEFKGFLPPPEVPAAEKKPAAVPAAKKAAAPTAKKPAVPAEKKPAAPAEKKAPVAANAK